MSQHLDIPRALRLICARSRSSLEDGRYLRAALDDVLDEGADPGEVRLVVDAVELGSLARMQSLTAAGAAPQAAIAEAGAGLARARASSEDGARWACAALAYGLGGLTDAEMTAYRHAWSDGAPVREAHSSENASPLTMRLDELAGEAGPRGRGPQPPVAPGPPAPGPPPSDRPRRAVPLVVASVAALVTIAVVAVVLTMIVRDDGGGPTRSGGTTAGTADSDSPEGLSDTDRLAAVAAAETAISAVVDRSYRTFDADVEHALPLLTPAFGDQFRKTTQDVREVFIQGRVVVRSERLGTAIASAVSDRVELLAFVDQRTTRGKSKPSTTKYTVVAVLVPDDDGWLLDDLETNGVTRGDESDPARRAALQDATAFAEAFNSLDYRTVDADLDRIEDLSTSPFLDEFTRSRNSLAELARQGRAVRTGDATGSGLESYGPAEATALIAVSSQISNGGADARSTALRMRVGLTLVGGRWLASSVDFVG